MIEKEGAQGCVMGLEGSMGVPAIEELIALVRVFPCESYLSGPRDLALVDAAGRRCGGSIDRRLIAFIALFSVEV
jgi:hypothetical protein